MKNDPTQAMPILNRHYINLGSHFEGSFLLKLNFSQKINEVLNEKCNKVTTHRGSLALPCEDLF